MTRGNLHTGGSGHAVSDPEAVPDSRAEKNTLRELVERLEKWSLRELSPYGNIQNAQRLMSQAASLLRRLGEENERLRSAPGTEANAGAVSHGRIANHTSPPASPQTAVCSGAQFAQAFLDFMCTDRRTPREAEVLNALETLARDIISTPARARHPARSIEERLAALERDSHPPIDLAPAIEEILADRFGLQPVCVSGHQPESASEGSTANQDVSNGLPSSFLQERKGE